MEVYIFQAALWCSECAHGIMSTRAKPRHVIECEESSYDSDDWPKGPYGEGGEEADVPQHCEGCNRFLENPLTSYGYEYVRDSMRALRAPSPIVSRWMDFYGLRA